MACPAGVEPATFSFGGHSELIGQPDENAEEEGEKPNTDLGQNIRELSESFRNFLKSSGTSCYTGATRAVSDPNDQIKKRRRKMPPPK
jgi:hypothetical protein